MLEEIACQCRHECVQEQDLSRTGGPDRKPNSLHDVVKIMQIDDQLWKSVSDYSVCRIDGVKVIPTNSPSGPMKRLTVCPQGSFLFLTNIR